MNILRDFLQKLFEGTDLHPHVQSLLVVLLMLVAWVILGFIVGSILRAFILKFLKPKERSLVKRQKTIAALLINIIKTAFWFYIIMMILNELGLDVGPILASAGILAFAIGFGAQELVKDFISGFFIIFENTFDVDDYIDVNGFTGQVLEVGLRKTKVVNWKNEVRLINNGDIRTVTNLSLKDSVGVVEIQVPNTFDLIGFDSDEFKYLLKSFKQAHDEIKSDIDYVGVISQTAFNSTIRFSFSTNCFQQFQAERDLRKEIISFMKDYKVN